MHIAIILNPTAGKSRLSEQEGSQETFESSLRRALEALQIEAEFYYTTPEDAGTDLARQLADRQVEYIVAAGGDGTIHAVALGLLNSSSILGIIPIGTMNNLAHSLGISDDLTEACQVLLNGEAQAVDVGCVNHQHFLEVAGVGLEASLYPAAEAVKSSGPLTRLKGAWEGLWKLVTYHPPIMRVTFDQERTRSYRAIQITVCNSPYYGAHLNVAPGIIMNDGLLDVVIYTNFSKGKYLRHAFSISQGKREFHPEIIHRRVKSLRIQTDPAIELHIDGTVIGKSPAEFSLLSGALKVQVPSQPGPGLRVSTNKQKQDVKLVARKGKAHV